MCDTCGCNDEKGYTISNPSDQARDLPHNHEHSHAHAAGDHNHSHAHDQPHSHGRISIETDILYQNNLLAQRNRGYFDAKNIVCLNLVSSPGSGKTTLLEKTILSLGHSGLYVIEGDQQTSLDAKRIMAAGASVLQVNTGNGCHLDADMISKSLKKLNPADHSLLIIENVGNLVCPALFDLGEQKRVLIMSVTEGDDKPLKYPNMFLTAHVCLINKTDLLPYVDFNLENFRKDALKVNPHLEFIALSAKTGEGFSEWTEWIRKLQK